MEAGQMVNLLRRLRHDYANHLQVISGYLELGWTEQISSYVKEIINQLNQERIIFESVAPEDALYFYEQLLTVRDMGIILVYDDLDVKSARYLQDRNEPVNSLTVLQPDIPAGDDETIVYISIHEDETGIEMYFSCDSWAEETRQIRIKKR
ncbi:MAG TPA: Spo0B domain-containing protein [Syntrophomonas sp.]|nr:Spo0B domain-containing protein [Syntrophomonas sp.]